MVRLKQITSLSLAAALTISLLSGCGQKEQSNGAKVTNTETALVFDDTAWNYDSENNVYWQIQVSYCSKPEAEEYETMGIYVPGDYMDGTKKEDGTYTCTLNTENQVGGFTAETAPIVLPVNTAGYSAQKAPESYSYQGISSYLESGFIYVYAGMRGRSNGYEEDGTLAYSGGAPWGVTDLKAAVRYYRYNQSLLPGDTDAIFTFGHSGGGAQSAVMGASGDSELYQDYLVSIGAAMYDAEGNEISDSICGAMCWCPITSLDYADEAYEWNMGQYTTDSSREDTSWKSALSDDLAEAYAEYINDMGLEAEDGTVLALEASDTGIYAAGSYYEYLLSEVEESLNHFLSDTEFPYTEGAGNMMGDGGFAGGSAPEGMEGERPEGMEGERPEGIPEGMDERMPEGNTSEGEKPGGQKPSGETQDKETETYDSAQAYIDALNGEDSWITYDAASNTAKISSMASFVEHCKTASKSVTAFDAFDKSQAENLLFGNDSDDQLHFDRILGNLLKDKAEEYGSYEDWEESILKEFESDLAQTDKLGNDMQTRQDMYNPMYYLSDYYEGYQTSAVASHWRIRTGIEQGDTALTVETNLALALQQYDSVADVDFETVWGQGHTTAERTGSSTDNFIAWVKECLEME